MVSKFGSIMRNEESRNTQCELSIVIKALNEEKNIERTLRSVLLASRDIDAEIILADSLSSDATIEIAKQFPIMIVQLEHANERCCGIGAQLGYQYAKGVYVLVIDGDMEVEREWLLAAIDRLKSNSRLGGVGGIVDDVNLDNIEFRSRQQRKPKDMQPGIVDRLNMGGLYRRSAIQDVGYLTHRSLHACEELELGLRLVNSGWILERLDMISIHHYGHTVPIWDLVKKRWRSRYVDGAGELLRSSYGKPWFWEGLGCYRLPLMVILWWSALFLSLVLSLLCSPIWLMQFSLLFFIPPLIMVIKKRSVSMGIYSVFAWCVDTSGLVRGLLTAQQNPLNPIDSKVLQIVD
jgi:glycosyltransferase involved in cell wall biosynthesis